MVSSRLQGETMVCTSAARAMTTSALWARSGQHGCHGRGQGALCPCWPHRGWAGPSMCSSPRGASPTPGTSMGPLPSALPLVSLLTRLAHGHCQRLSTVAPWQLLAARAAGGYGESGGVAGGRCQYPAHAAAQAMPATARALLPPVRLPGE